MTPPAAVRAAGGVVWRPSGSAQVEVLVVHRPRGDWSFPKGKHEQGESDESCAVREVEEETGYRGRLGADLGTTRHTVSGDVPKVVRWWAMTVVGGTPGADDGDEVDAVRWVPVDAAPALLTYDSDREVLGRFLAAGDGRP